MNIKKIFSAAIILSIVSLTVIPIGKLGLVHAQQSTDLTNAQADKVRLEAELAKLEQEIAEKQNELNAQKGQSKTLQNDVSLLTTKISKAKLDIKSKNLTISKLGGEIKNKTATIGSLTEKISREKASLGQLLRKTNEIDRTSFVNLVLSDDSLSDFYGDVDNFQSIKRDIKASVEEITGVKTETESEKVALMQKQDAEEEARALLESAKKQVETSEKEKQQLLSISKNKEVAYQQVLAEKAKRRAAILSALFNLRDAKAIAFGDALKYATEASQITGVRPAFILAILTQESNLGTDQGSCYVTNFDTGSGISTRSGKAFPNVMKPLRDIPPFLTITKALGRDATKTLVSCPIGGYGYGGAMGPAQFIPSTWMGLQSKIQAAIGTTPNPWAPRDAFIASALFLKDLGAGAGTYNAEKTAACKYYGGGTYCTAVTSPYGLSVMTKAQNIQQNMIDPLQNS